MMKSTTTFRLMLIPMAIIAILDWALVFSALLLGYSNVNPFVELIGGQNMAFILRMLLIGIMFIRSFSWKEVRRIKALNYVALAAVVIMSIIVARNMYIVIWKLM